MAAMTFSVRHGRSLILSLVLVSLAMVGVIWWYYERQREATEAAIKAEVAAIAEAKVTQIANWRRERLGDGRVQASSPTMEIARRVLSARSAASTDSADRAHLIQVMKQLELEFLYTGAFLVDRDGGIRVQYPPDHPAPSRLADFARAGAIADDVKFEDLYLDQRSGRPLMALNIPVGGLGALIMEIDPARFLDPYVRSWPVPHTSAESYLVRVEGDNDFVYLTKLRYRPEITLADRRSLKGLKLPPREAFESGWQAQVSDYRGVPVLGTIRHVPNSPWYLVAKVDATEVDAPGRRLGWEMILIVGLLGVVNVAVAGLIWEDQQANMHQDREAWFRAVVNDTPANLWMTFGEAADSYINTRFAKFLGIDKEVLSENWNDYLHPDDVERARVTFLECLRERREYADEFRMRRFDGEFRWVTSQGLPRFSPKGEFLGYAGSFIDITGRRLAEQQLRTSNAALADELAERTRQEKEIRSLSARLMNAQEEERGRLARELHDDLSQQIAALSIAMGNWKRQIPVELADVRSHSDRIQEKLVQTAETVRRISHQLHPAVLEHSGLESALRAYCEEFSSLTDIRVSFDADESVGRVEPSVALGLFRITQEALQNVAKHAQAAEAQVTLRRSEEQLCLTIADSGVGMELSAEYPSAGLGLVSIKERTRLIHGTVEISSGPNQGTTVIVKVPQGAVEHVAAV
jgi:two-component system sensor histidine kinase UhpB